MHYNKHRCCTSKRKPSGTFLVAIGTSTHIEEALVYFSGHGVYQTDALLCCSDFDPKRPASTSLTNTEIDDLLRSMAPGVAVKIIDACQSGSPYIKDATAGFEKALRESQLKAFICMASSQTNQFSYATTECSAFTDRLIDAALFKTEGTVLYRDIQAALADSFVGNPEQTPFFVIQGTGLEVFSTVTPEMRALATARSKAVQSAEREDTIVARLSEEVSRMDAMYVSAEIASHAVEQAGRDLDRESLSHPLVSQFYEKKVSREHKFPTLPRRRTIAQVASEQGWEKKFFVVIAHEDYRVRVPRDPFAVFGSLSLTRKLGDEDYVTETRQRPALIEVTHPLPFEIAEITFEPKDHPSLRPFIVYIGLIHSLTELMVLSATAGLRVTGWTDREVEESELQWQHQSYLWKDIVGHPELIWKEALARGEQAVAAYLESLLQKKDGTASVVVQNSNTKNTSSEGKSS